MGHAHNVRPGAYPVVGVRLRSEHTAIRPALSADLRTNRIIGTEEEPLDFVILGPLELRQNGIPLDLGARLQRILTTLLVVNAGRLVLTDRIRESCEAMTRKERNGLSGSPSRAFTLYSTRSESWLETRSYSRETTDSRVSTSGDHLAPETIRRLGELQNAIIEGSIVVPAFSMESASYPPDPNLIVDVQRPPTVSRCRDLGDAQNPLFASRFDGGIPRCHIEFHENCGNVVFDCSMRYEQVVRDFGVRHSPGK